MYPWGYHRKEQFSRFIFFSEYMAMSDAQLHAPTTTLFHHSLIMSYYLVCCFCVVSHTMNHKEKHFRRNDKPLRSTWSFSASPARISIAYSTRWCVKSDLTYIQAQAASYIKHACHLQHAFQGKHNACLCFYRFKSRYFPAAVFEMPVLAKTR